jgi:hypothetical protein
MDADNLDGADMTQENFTEAAQAFAAQVHAIPGQAWEKPGLGTWSVRDLVGHTCRALTTTEDYLAKPAAEEEVTSPVAYYTLVHQVDHTSVAARGGAAGRALGSDPAIFVDNLVARVLPLARDAGDPLIETFFGGMRFRNYLPTRTFELVVHGLDISAAVGLPTPAYSSQTLQEVLGIATGVATATGRGGELISALTGRSTLPAGFSVV